jgi:hypothetical protein
MRNYLIAAVCFIGLVNWGLSQVDLSPLRAYADSRAQQIDNEISMHGQISADEDRRARASLQAVLDKLNAQVVSDDCKAYKSSIEQELAFAGRISTALAVQLQYAKQFRNCHPTVD